VVASATFNAVISFVSWSCVLMMSSSLAGSKLAWWTTAFEDIVKSSAIISNQDGSAMQSAADRFTQVDVEHVRSIGPMVAQESVRRLCDMLFSRTQEANLLHTTLR